MTGVLASRLVRPWVRAHLPARTIRLRLTLVYGSLFLLSGALYPVDRLPPAPPQAWHRGHQ